MKLNEIVTLITTYGKDTTLEEVLRKVAKNKSKDGIDKIYKCPKCEGKGFITKRYNKYPSGLPDSGFVYEEGFKDIECDLCKGEGYTDHEYKPKMVQEGWE